MSLTDERKRLEEARKGEAAKLYHFESDRRRFFRQSNTY
jgi:hypothetical protein